MDLPLLRLRDCAAQDEAGPKARRLGRALVLGLPVLDGLVVLPGAPLPDAGALAAALAGLVPPVPAPRVLLSLGPGLVPGPRAGAPPAGRFAVRSSAAVEDLAERSAAGLFLSRVNVPPDEVAAAIEAVRASGQSAAVRAYCGGPVPVAVLIQPMAAADRLGVLWLEPGGAARCEERPAAQPEWSDVEPREPDARDPGDAALLSGARRLAQLIKEETGADTPPAVLVEYARAADGTVTFLQVRPAPRGGDAADARAAASWPVPADALTYRLDRGHNPDPLSRAQAALVDGVDDLVPALRQRVLRGYLYYAEAGPPPALIPPDEIAARFHDELAPACEALLRPLEARILADDGALDPRCRADPARAAVPLDAAWAAYRGVYRRYIGELGPSLRRARGHLDALLRANLGEPLSQHGGLVAGVARAQAERLHALRAIGRLGDAGAGADFPSGPRHAALRGYLARYGAYAPCWDVAVPCDDEVPARVLAAAAQLATERDPLADFEAAQAAYHRAVQAVLDRLPRMARGALKSLLPAVRAALGVGEDDDALFFRAQRLLRWALLHRGARLQQAGRLPNGAAVFDLPWVPRGDAAALVLSGSDPDESGEPPGEAFDPLRFAAGADLARLAEEGAQARVAARALTPPDRIANGRAHWALPAGAVLLGYGIGAATGPGPDGEPGALLHGRARVIASLDEPAEAALAGLRGDEVLILPAILPSWAQHLGRARALVTDSGGALSHGAILARERGLPAVLGARGATRAIKDGQIVFVDPARGRVYLAP